jgi:hypothetical protein
MGSAEMGLPPLARHLMPLTWSGYRERSCGVILIARLDLLGAVVALLIYVSSIVVFSARMIFGLPRGHWIGVPFLLMAFPLGFLLYKAPSVNRPLLYYLQVGLMLASVVVLFLLDYVSDVEWRGIRSVVVSVVVLYFAGLGGMIGVASQAGQPWTTVAVVLFFATATTAFVHDAVTGM